MRGKAGRRKRSMWLVIDTKSWSVPYKLAGWISADGTRVYRAPTVKSSQYATTGVQANFEIYSINPVTGQKIKVSNGHLNVTD